MTISITLEGQIAKLEDLLNQAKRSSKYQQVSAAIDKQNELMGFKIQRVESKRVDEFANMSDEELRQSRRVARRTLVTVALSAV